ncbi:hypothetical protein CALVIDRAFT_388421 [Calocera viscosa TUFC12733]|uniref:Uncharacterized protein n=1 Tax=Calocera viscosa (strain TUFC12733) TaxID=1330018 RepID=A0A167GME9_CALVF|nr:hypothetical protein CALVIDRAFT_388421 [Calocera viscosa TUFC12733]
MLVYCRSWNVRSLRESARSGLLPALLSGLGWDHGVTLAHWTAGSSSGIRIAECTQYTCRLVFRDTRQSKAPGKRNAVCCIIIPKRARAGEDDVTRPLHSRFCASGRRGRRVCGEGHVSFPCVPA